MKNNDYILTDKEWVVSAVEDNSVGSYYSWPRVFQI